MVELEAYCRIRGPIGPWRDEQQFALLAYAIVASNSGKPKRHKIGDFLLWSGGRRPHEFGEDEDEAEDDEPGDD